MSVMEWEAGLITAAVEAGHLQSQGLENCSAFVFMGGKKDTGYLNQTLRHIVDLTEKMIPW